MSRLSRPAAGTLLTTAHGGAAWSAPPNTRAALVAALDAQPTWIEVDLHLSRDGEVVLWHDAELYTPAGKHVISEMSWPELKQLKLIDGEMITLPEALALAGTRCGLMLDLKSAGLADPIRQALEGHDPARHLVCGGDLPTFNALRGFMPLSLTPPERFYHDPAAFLTQPPGFDAVTVYWRMVDKRLIEAVHAAGLLVLAWTVDYPAAAEHLQKLGVDGITSNNMSLLAELRAQP